MKIKKKNKKSTRHLVIVSLVIILLIILIFNMHDFLQGLKDGAEAARGSF